MSLSAINHKKFDLLHELTNNNTTKAKLLDLLIFWWQGSTYTLNDNQKWFTRSITRIAEDSGISKRSVERYLGSFAETGLIEKRCILIRKKNLYIRITDKLLSYLGKKPAQAPKQTQQKKALSDQKFNVLPSNDVTEDTTMAVSYIESKDQILNNNSTVSQNGIVNNSDELTKNPSKPAQTNKEGDSEYKVESVLGERITERFKNYVKGVLKNLKTQHNLAISNPDKLFAEVIFSVTNTKEQFPGIENPHHRMNIIAKLLRDKRWKTPKGFYNHWDIGQQFKEQEEVKARAYKNSKLEEGISSVSDSQQSADVKARYQQSYQTQNRAQKSNKYEKETQKRKFNAQVSALKREIQSETNYLEQAKGWFSQKVAGITESFIESLENKIAAMYEQLTGIEQELTS